MRLWHKMLKITWNEGAGRAGWVTNDFVSKIDI